MKKIESKLSLFVQKGAFTPVELVVALTIIVLLVAIALRALHLNS